MNNDWPRAFLGSDPAQGGICKWSNLLWESVPDRLAKAILRRDVPRFRVYEVKPDRVLCAGERRELLAGAFFRVAGILRSQ